MRSHPLLSIAAIAGLAFAGIAAGGDTCRTVGEGDDAVELCESQQWVRDPGHKVGNAGVTGAVAFPTLSPDAPETSVTGGAGGGYAGHLGQGANGSPGPETTLTIRGQVTGLIDVMHLTLHSLVYNGYGRTGGPTDRSDHTAYVEIDIDGAPLVFQTQVEFVSGDAPTANAAMQHQVVLTGLLAAMEDAHSYDGISLDPDAVHDLEIRITPRWANTDAAVIYAYDTTEVPSNIVFNPAVLPEGVPAY